MLRFSVSFIAPVTGGRDLSHQRTGMTPMPPPEMAPVGTRQSVTRQAPAGVGRRRWTIGVLLGIGILINYFDRVNISVAAPQL